MAYYTLTDVDAVVRIKDMAVISADPLNSDWREYQDWLAAGGVPDPMPQDLIGYAAAARYAKEIGGITVAGIPVATDDRSKQMIMGARIAADADPGFTTPWVAADGSIHTVDAATMIAISNAVLTHVAQCFAIYAEVKMQIDSDTITTLAEIDAAFA